MTSFMLTLDYELFFGDRTGTVERSLIEPTDALARCIERHGGYLCLFVDATYLLRARECGKSHASVRRDYSLVTSQLAALSRRGHDIQLHVHPHWHDMKFDGTRWTTDASRYRLNDFDDRTMTELVAMCVTELSGIRETGVSAYRAGGWCIQPAPPIISALRACGVWIDSTVYRGGYSEVAGREYDFRAAPAQSGYWRFRDDPLIPDPLGDFLEIPISACRYGPSAFWRLAWRKLIARPADRPYGDGSVMHASSRYYLRRLLGSTWSPVSIDGAKASLLGNAFAKSAADSGSDIFNVMGHPKSVTPNGIRHLDRFLSARGGALELVTFADFGHLKAPLQNASAG